MIVVNNHRSGFVAPTADFIRWLMERLSMARLAALLFDPAGQLHAMADKQTLMGHENTWRLSQDLLMSWSESLEATKHG